jgi:hypothetical protein
MENNSVLYEAIKKLREINDKLEKEKASKTSLVDIERIDKQIVRNNTMIMDYEFRTKYNK